MPGSRDSSAASQRDARARSRSRERPASSSKSKPKPKPKAKAKVKRAGGLAARVAMWNKTANKHKDTQATNPFSGSGGGGPKALKRGDKGYGTAAAGSKTAARAKKA